MEILQKRLERLLGQHQKTRTEARPITILAYAQSLDGAIGIRNAKTPLILSSAMSFKLTHSIRNACGGILVGIGTVLADSPSLTTRLELEEVDLGRDKDRDRVSRNARPVIVDSGLQCPVDAKFMAKDRHPIILTSAICERRNRVVKDDADARERRRQALVDAGAVVVDVPHSCSASCSTLADGNDNYTSYGGRVDLVKAFEYLYTDLDMKSIMIEGGAKIIHECLSRSDFVVDELIVTIAPRIVGGGGGSSSDTVYPFASSPSFGGGGSLQLSNVEWAKLGPDFCLFSSPQKKTEETEKRVESDRDILNLPE